MPAIRVEGVTELKAAFKAADREYQKSIQVELREIGGIVAEQAKSFAIGQGLYDTGALVDAIKPGVQGFTAVVRDAANQNGFNYPAVYEGELAGHGLRGRGPRPFMAPAIDAKEAEILAGLDGILDRVAADF